MNSSESVIDSCRCETITPPPTREEVRLRQLARWAIKQTIWTPVTALMGWIGLRIQTIQVLLIDRAADHGLGRVLMLWTREIDPLQRLTMVPVQGLRHSVFPGLGYAPDASIDALRELKEEAVPEPPDLESFQLAARYREGRWRQFDCSVFVVECSMDEVTLSGEFSEGVPCWGSFPFVRDRLSRSKTQLSSTRMLLELLKDSEPNPPVADLKK